jgi:hypothetical protein
MGRRPPAKVSLGMSRHIRRSDLAKFKREAAGAMDTFLVGTDDPMLAREPLLGAATRWWLAGLSARVRHCFVCGSYLIGSRDVGGVLLATPVAAPTSVSIHGICSPCWHDDLPADVLEKAAIEALRPAVGKARFA